MTKVKVCVCPYCGDTQPVAERCRSCSGLFEPLSRQATHNAMGPWFIRVPDRPFQPGCSYETLVRMIEQGRVTKFTIMRGPTTRQFWQVARRVPGVAHLLGYCHQCDHHVNPRDLNCAKCGVAFGAYLDRNHLGLPEVNPLPWDVDEDDAASTAVFRQYFNPPRLQATGLSSFAHDEDLVARPDDPTTAPDPAPGSALRDAMGGPLIDDDVDHDEGDGITHDHGGRQRESTAARGWSGEPEATPSRSGIAAASRTAPQPTQRAEALPGFETYSMNARLRSMERRLASQRARTRIALLILGVAAVYIIALHLGWVGTLPPADGPATPPAATAPNSAAAGEAPDNDAAPADDSDSPRRPGGDGDGAVGEESRDSDAADPVDDRNRHRDEDAEASPPPPQSIDDPDAVASEYRQALRIGDESRRDDLSREERIARAREALKMLRLIRDRLPRNRWPSDELPFHIDRLDRELLRLERGAFFDEV